MRNTCSVVLPRLTTVLATLVLGSISPHPLWAKGTLENPQPGSFQSGIGVISGWVCDASKVDIVVDGAATPDAAYGTSREDTRSVCGDANNGFGLLINWNLLGDGEHKIRALADGVEFGSATFTVMTLGMEFLRGVIGQHRVPNFPTSGFDTIIRWQESAQNFVIVGLEPHSLNGGGNTVCEEHFVLDVSDFGDFIMLDDGSIWEVDFNVSFTWLFDDVLLCDLKSNFFGTKTIINLNEADLDGNLVWVIPAN